MADDSKQWCPQVGETLSGRYLIRREVGRGLHGIVFMAEHNSDQRLYRVKILHPDLFLNPERGDSNLFRIRRVLAYRDPSILKISDVLDLPQTCAVVSPWVTGTTLADDLDERARLGKVFAPMEALPIFTDVVTGLRWINKFGAHGNLRPENFLLGSEGTLLLDPFRLQFATDLDHMADHSDYAQRAARFLAPEQTATSDSDDPRSDVYALGILLGQVLTGVPVQSGRSLGKQGGGQVTEEIDELFSRATQAKPEDRIPRDEFFRMAGELLTEASEKRVGFARSENITLVTGVPAMTDELLEAVEADKKKRKEAAEAAAAALEEREGFGRPTLCDHDGLASEGTLLQGAALPDDQKELIEEALEESLKRGGSVRTFRDAVPDFKQPKADLGPQDQPTASGEDLDEHVVEEARKSAQEDVLASVRGSMDSQSEDDEFSVDLEEILEELDSVEAEPGELGEAHETGEETDVLDPTIEIGVDFDFEEIATDATPAPEEIEIEVIEEADLLLEGMDTESDMEDVGHPPESLLPNPTEVPSLHAIELGASDLEVEEITAEVAHEIAHQLHVEAIGETRDAQKPYGGVDTDRIGVPAGGFKDQDRTNTGLTWPPVIVGLVLIGFIALLFVKVIGDDTGRRDDNSADMRPSDSMSTGGVLMGQDGWSVSMPDAASDSGAIATREDVVSQVHPDTKQAVVAADQTEPKDNLEARVKAGPEDAGLKTRDAGPAVEDTATAVAPSPTDQPVPVPPVVEPAAAPAPAAPPPAAIVLVPVASCPMNFVRVPGKEEVSAFCMQTHEYPGVGLKPKVRISLEEAQDLCGEVGARLCRRGEFPLACDGRYPYGKGFRRSRCNVAGEFFDERRVRNTGWKKKCVSSLGIYDLSGNVAEWLEGGYTGGGSSSESGAAVSCTRTPKKNPKRRYAKVGFRCCLSLLP